MTHNSTWLALMLILAAVVVLSACPGKNMRVDGPATQPAYRY